MRVLRWLGWLALLVAIAGLCAAGTALWWLNRPLPLVKERVEVSIEPGQTPREVARAWVDAGVSTHPELLYAWFRLSGDDRAIRAGSFEVEVGITPRGLLDKMVRGDEVLAMVTFVEGWTFAQMREAMARSPYLRHTLAAASDAELMEAIGAPGVHPEGRFFPDTYAFSRGASDQIVLERAYAAMQRRLDAAWAERRADLPLRTPEEALILASIVEKETGLHGERGMVASVFVNRLRIGMPLQTDPTVIYGMGARFDGNLRKRDLQTDTPYNTYLRRGLPPTPIAMPGEASLRAVMQPVQSKAIYFVSRGDGSSEFSETLDAHNRAVDKYQRGRR